MLEVCFSAFQSFQSIEFQQTQELIHSIRKEIIPEMSKMLNAQSLIEAKTAIETRGENKKLLEQFEKVSKVKPKYFRKK